MRISLIILLIVSALPATAQIHLVAYISERMQGERLPEGEIRDGGYITVIIVNRSNDRVILPSKLGRPKILSTKEKIEFHFSYESDTFVSRSGHHPVIPSRESFGPVTMGPGEAMRLDPFVYIWDYEDVREKPVTVFYEVSGLLVKRFGFTPTRLKTTPITSREYQRTPVEQRAP